MNEILLVLSRLDLPISTGTNLSEIEKIYFFHKPIKSKIEGIKLVLLNLTCNEAQHICLTSDLKLSYQNKSNVFDPI